MFCCIDYHNLFIHHPLMGNLGCFYLLVIVGGAALNMNVHVPIQVPAFNSLDYKPRFGIVGS